MSDLVIDTGPEYKQAAARAAVMWDAGKDVIDLPAIRREAFIHGYACALIDMKYGLDRRKLLRKPFGPAP